MKKTTDLVNDLQRFINEHHLVQKGDKVLLAVSGGLDSVLMVHLFKQAGIGFGIAHCNFQLRGVEADGDEESVKTLAEKMGVPFYSTRFETQQFADEKGISIQMAARDLRYEWLEEMRKTKGYVSLATAHHKNDNVETLLMNLVKGTGIAGLKGILPKSNHLIRPLLNITRKQLEQYASDNQLQWREDKSNADTKYRRNHIRHQVIPQLESINPNAVETLGENIERFRDAEQVYQYGLQRLLKKLVEVKGNDIYISIPKLKLLPASKTLLFEIIKDFGFNNLQLEEVMGCLDTTESKQFMSAQFRIIKERKQLVITGLESEDTTLVLLGERHLQKPTKLSGFELKYHLQTSTNYSIPQGNNIAAIDYGQLQFPLTLRKWKTGDYFYPTGMKNKKKKLSKFFMDIKLPLIEKENVWVMLSGEKIVWVVGLRLDERFKVTGRTKQVLEVKVHNISHAADNKKK